MKVLFVALVFLALPALASIDVYQFDSPEQEVRYQALIADFRCPTCQNQNLAGSDAPIAQDLKQKTYEMIKDGRSDGEIRSFMIERYGDFISYKPPVRPSTWILWFFPPMVLLLALGAWVYAQQKKRPSSNAVSNTAKPLSDDEEKRLQALLDDYANKTDKKDTP